MATNQKMVPHHEGHVPMKRWSNGRKGNDILHCLGSSPWDGAQSGWLDASSLESLVVWSHNYLLFYCCCSGTRETGHVTVGTCPDHPPVFNFVMFYPCCRKVRDLGVYYSSYGTLVKNGNICLPAATRNFWEVCGRVNQTWRCVHNRIY